MTVCLSVILFNLIFLSENFQNLSITGPFLKGGKLYFGIMLKIKKNIKENIVCKIFRNVSIRWFVIGKWKKKATRSSFDDELKVKVYQNCEKNNWLEIN